MAEHYGGRGHERAGAAQQVGTQPSLPPTCMQGCVSCLPPSQVRRGGAPRHSSHRSRELLRVRVPPPLPERVPPHSTSACRPPLRVRVPSPLSLHHGSPALCHRPLVPERCTHRGSLHYVARCRYGEGSNNPDRYHDLAGAREVSWPHTQLVHRMHTPACAFLSVGIGQLCHRATHHPMSV